MDYSTISFLDSFNFTKAFLGTGSCSPTMGVSCAHEAEASKKRTVLSRTGHGFLLCDAGKMNRTAFLRFAGAADFDGIFTDAALSQTLQQQYRAAGAKRILCCIAGRGHLWHMKKSPEVFRKTSGDSVLLISHYSSMVAKTAMYSFPGRRTCTLPLACSAKVVLVISQVSSTSTLYVWFSGRRIS